MSEESTTTTPEADATEATEPQETAATEVDWKEKARLWERRAKENKDAAKRATELEQKLDEAAKAQMSEQEKAVAAAREEGRSEAMQSLASLKVENAVIKASEGRGVDVDALLEGIDPTRFVKDGEPDPTAIEAWLDRIAPKKPEDSFPDLGQGTPGTQKNPELTSFEAGVRTR